MAEPFGLATDIDVLVVGAGPSGLFAAEMLASRGLGVVVVDTMRLPGRKFLLAGRGGLNITHSEPLSRFVERYGEAAEHLEPMLERFGPEHLRDWCAALGEPTFVGTSGRVFPRSFRATPLLRSWLGRLSGLGVRFFGRHRWQGWTEDGALRLSIADAPSEQGSGSTAVHEVQLRPRAVLLVLGGASWPGLGSDGNWLPHLRAASVEVAPLVPANCGVEIEWSEHFRMRFAGEPLKGVSLSCDGKTERGEALVTAEGLEGGAVYALTEAIRRAFASGERVTLNIDLRPDVSIADLHRALARTPASQSLGNRLRRACALPPVATALLRETGSAGQLFGLFGGPEALASRIKNVRLSVGRFRPIEKAISSAGGVSWAALDHHLMLRARPGVFVAGEMIDWTAPTGGYLLQACFSTAHCAGEGILNWLAAAHGCSGHRTNAFTPPEKA